jgi:hypothetical protein
MTNTSAPASEQAARVEVTVYEKSRGPLSKSIHLADTGKIANDSSACSMAKGSARRADIDLANLQTYVDLIHGFSSRQALSLGRLNDGLPDRVKVVVADKLPANHDPSVIARTKNFLTFDPGKPALALFDFDPKGMSAPVLARVNEIGGFWNAACPIIPELAQAARVNRASTSSGLSNRATGERYPDLGGLHSVVAIADGADNHRFLYAMHDRAWLCGYGWGMVSAAGSFLERSIIDRSVGSPERLVFEGPPLIDPQLVQAPRLAVAYPGSILDTKICCAPLSPAEQDEVQKLKDAERARLKPEMDATRAK